MATVERKCERCGKAFQAKVADVKRGWAKCCSKSCAAAKREKILVIPGLTAKVYQLYKMLFTEEK